MLFGLIACRRSLPSMQHLLAHLAAALDELEPGDDAASGRDTTATAGGR